jgi:hypothetical protein
MKDLNMESQHQLDTRIERAEQELRDYARSQIRKHRPVGAILPAEITFQSKYIACTLAIEDEFGCDPEMIFGGTETRWVVANLVDALAMERAEKFDHLAWIGVECARIGAVEDPEDAADEASNLWSRIMNVEINDA